MTIDYQVLREAAERAIPAMERLLMLPADDDLLSEQELKDYGVDIDALNAFKFLAGPETVLALLDEREAKDKAWSAQDNHINQQADRIESLEKKNGELGRTLEAAEKRIAELEKQCAESERKALSNFEECAAMAERIEEMQPSQHHDDTLYVRADLVNGNSPVTPDGWISCSERMPEIRQTVIGWNGYAVRQCVYTRNEYAKTQKGREPRFEILTGIWHGVTHWMPLPEPPQEVK
ncbi:TPA: DUF551 domain-containing protein [Escherichia coli]|nr:DUF551 domain-containing protein [Escherichia coli]